MAKGKHYIGKPIKTIKLSMHWLVWYFETSLLLTWLCIQLQKHFPGHYEVKSTNQRKKEKRTSYFPHPSRKTYSSISMLLFPQIRTVNIISILATTVLWSYHIKEQTRMVNSSRNCQNFDSGHLFRNFQTN